MSDRQAVETTVHLYVEGMAFGNAGALKKAFHPQASIIGNYQGAVEWLTRDAFIEAVLAEESADPASQPFMDIHSIDVAGDTASAKVTDDFAGLRFTDLLSLLKVDGHWQIVSKVYYIHP
ncbi:nuclear transport factor 2 family protein [Rhizobium sp. NRK18]|uniref:nuclear transport factor 2 family protein n=1 Tax=Rhizobium sp. NRK18 TaxID=2964667 RepID=UPI0021C355E5|nr:nuclear transport factor 2 family protein [Rhizobium sp. NRK18]MCQ2005663.1 nuclear transport factor 2 family protein [Rhizobium sp. NRK18]